MKGTLKTRLCVMMFLQYGIWGLWCVTMGTFLLQGLKFEGGQVGLAYSTTAWAAMISPFFVGMIADRFFAGEKVLAILHIVGGVFLAWASTATAFGDFFLLLLAYALCYMPTLALTNAISFHQMKNPGQEFPAIRVFGTIGWIAAGVIISFGPILIGRLAGVMGYDMSTLPEWIQTTTLIEATAIPMRAAAALSIVMGLYCFTLPHTPPQAAGKKATVSDILGLETLKLMKDRSFLIFVLSSLLICIPLSFYYGFANPFLNESGIAKAASKMTLGQGSEIFFMILIPFFFARLGIKKMLLTGMLAWAARYVLFAMGNSQSLVFMYYIGILLHGICYDFFFVIGQIYVDKKAPLQLRANAQGFIAFITMGVGMAIGAPFAGWIVQRYELMDAAGKVIGHDWKSIWLIPAAMAFVVVIIFALFFREKENNNQKLQQA